MPRTAPFADLDAMLTPEECGQWLGMHPKAVMQSPRIPKVKIGHHTVRYHVRTVIEHFKPKVRK